MLRNKIVDGALYSSILEKNDSIILTVTFDRNLVTVI